MPHEDQRQMLLEFFKIEIFTFILIFLFLAQNYTIYLNISSLKFVFQIFPPFVLILGAPTVHKETHREDCMGIGFERLRVVDLCSSV